MESIYRLPLILEPQPEGGYTITCPIWPEWITEADTVDEVNENVADAIAALIDAYQILGRTLPPALMPLASLATSEM
ncbi:MAG: type II toxin-antitoxin system HicB family antitoxin [Chloroflexi bacterium]|nr:type II toxin-antitoxin system HicB family antitoxin [Chloroflexota bacterium]